MVSFESRSRFGPAARTAVLLSLSLGLIEFAHAQFSTTIIEDGVESNISSESSGSVVVQAGGTAVVRGGNISGLSVEPGADVTIVGDHFWVNDTPLNLDPGGTTRVLIRAGDSSRSGDFVSGRLVDGQVFSIQKGLNSFSIPSLGAATIRFERSTEPVAFSEFVDISGDDVTQVTAGQTLRLNANKPRFEPAPRVQAYQGSRVEISGEQWTPSLDAYNATIHMSSGNAAPTNLYLGSEFYVSGGTMNGINQIYEGSRLTITGGSHPDPIWSTDSGPFARIDGGEVVIVGTDFSLRHPSSDVAMALSRLGQPGDSVVVERRERIAGGQGGTLPLTIEATLMDGEPLAWELSRSYVGGLLGKETVFAERLTARFTIGFPKGYCDFDSSSDCDDDDVSLLQAQFGSGDRHFDLNYDGSIDERDVQLLQQNITLDSLIGDIDNSGTVEFPDFLILSASYGADVEPGTSGDLDKDGVVAFADFLLLSQNYGAAVDISVSPVPEPSGGMLAAISSFALFLARWSSRKRISFVHYHRSAAKSVRSA